MNIWIIRHVEYERLGHIPEILDELKLPYRSISLATGDQLPPLDEVAGVITMGGPMSAYEKEKYNWIEKEEKFVRAVHERGIPLLAICLGAQILVQALGAKVHKAPITEIGWLPLIRTLNDEGSILSGLDIPPLFQFHGDIFELPKGACNLLKTEKSPHQMFQLGQTTYGIQFHPEADENMLRGVAKEYVQILPDGASEDMLQDIEKRSSAGRQFLYQLLKRLFTKN